jgi:hypothetical protein
MAASSAVHRRHLHLVVPSSLHLTVPPSSSSIVLLPRPRRRRRPPAPPRPPSPCARITGCGPLLQPQRCHRPPITPLACSVLPSSTPPTSFVPPRSARPSTSALPHKASPSTPRYHDLATSAPPSSYVRVAAPCLLSTHDTPAASMCHVLAPPPTDLLCQPLCRPHRTRGRRGGSGCVWGKRWQFARHSCKLL